MPRVSSRPTRPDAAPSAPTARGSVHRATFHVTTAVAATSAIAPTISRPRIDASTCRRIRREMDRRRRDERPRARPARRRRTLALCHRHHRARLARSHRRQRVHDARWRSASRAQSPRPAHRRRSRSTCASVRCIVFARVHRSVSRISVRARCRCARTVPSATPRSSRHLAVRESLDVVQHEHLARAFGSRAIAASIESRRTGSGVPSCARSSSAGSATGATRATRRRSERSALSTTFVASRQSHAPASLSGLESIELLPRAHEHVLRQLGRAHASRRSCEGTTHRCGRRARGTAARAMQPAIPRRRACAAGYGAARDGGGEAGPERGQHRHPAKILRGAD